MKPTTAYLAWLGAVAALAGIALCRPPARHTPAAAPLEPRPAPEVKVRILGWKAAPLARKHPRSRTHEFLLCRIHYTYLGTAPLNIGLRLITRRGNAYDNNSDDWLPLPDDGREIRVYQTEVFGRYISVYAWGFPAIAESSGDLVCVVPKGERPARVVAMRVDGR